jgi:hypothetical protein
VNDLYLGIIAVAVAAMAVIQVVAIVVAMRTARRVGDVVTRLRGRCPADRQQPEIDVSRRLRGRRASPPRRHSAPNSSSAT